MVPQPFRASLAPNAAGSLSRPTSCTRSPRVVTRPFSAAPAASVGELPPSRSVRLLPGFDPYVVAAPHTGHLLPGDFGRRVYRPQGWISPVLLVNGRMEGTWRHEVKGSHVEGVIEPFVKAPAWVRCTAGQEAERLAAFLGCASSPAWKS
ncbi:MAG TPA: crosslink repair DNA glycosylase YcaQ family protein [Bryobacteraceae bacterium]|nr:crosslink repair DNA glycosylase YcaQ family protein [Bryobacteraceae bacterium]